MGIVLFPERQQRLVHRLVLEAFGGPCPDGMECRHLDGVRTNNAASNLCWGTRQDNADDRKRHGRAIKGERDKNSKLTPEKVRAIRIESADGASHAYLGRKYGVCNTTIWQVVIGRKWTHVA